MGQALCSCLQTQGIALVKSLLANLPLDFTTEQWNAAHNSGTISENEGELASLGTDLKKCADSALPKNMSKAAFICCNTYTKPSYSLGVGPMNDAITVATFLKEKGFAVYYLHNPTSADYLKYLKHMLGHTNSYLMCYYTGHGASVDDDNGDETDGKDEALVFDDAFVRDDVLIELLANSGKPEACKVVFMNDCCHSGSIWDLQRSKFNGKTLPPNMMSLSAARDSETAKQTSMEGNDQGIFTFYFFKLLEQSPSLTPAQMASSINSYLTRFEQQFVHCATTESLLSTSIF